jgi:SAM-dependent methyltransferase
VAALEPALSALRLESAGMIGTPDPARWTEQPPERFGPMSGYCWRTDPRHVLFTLARYQVVAKLLAGRDRVLEIGCADAFGTRLVAAETRWAVTAIDYDGAMIDAAKQQTWAQGRHPKIDVYQHDLLLGGPIPGHDAAYAVDVLEHIPAAHEATFLRHACQSITPDGVLVVGTPSRESQAYASAPSREGHVNCKTQDELRALMSQHCKTVFTFGQNDATFHIGYGPMCHYLWAVGVTPRVNPRPVR